MRRRRAEGKGSGQRVSAILSLPRAWSSLAKDTGTQDILKTPAPPAAFPAGPDLPLFRSSQHS